MQYDLYQIDAFADRLFAGNPAAVVPLEIWLPDATMQLIARENNLSETAFFVPLGEADRFHIRWFTPITEVQLCGHATLATAFVIFNHLKTNQSDTISFDSLSGWLMVSQEEGLLWLDFPTDVLTPAILPEAARLALNIQPKTVQLGREDYLLEYASEEEVRALTPDFRGLARVDARGFIATAPGGVIDFVSRCFFPAFGIDEDPATGSAHTTLTPFWAARLGKNVLVASQISARGGHLLCRLQGERVLIGGKARFYLQGKFVVE